ncbi:hypothetical protein [Cryobacterium sp. PH31-O1]|uniref:hypothetical protein n=1 Tax=Cryobacterium sp. PH31-O1 TaxID=3046306 RepID=UPI0024BB2C1A|nr:hypothetical protein [Cryobacterium sp. PH31-O1]MDJ0338274.1 hypothetical protein [Cryobacterium sp. PH31-O1]
MTTTTDTSGFYFREGEDLELFRASEWVTAPSFDLDGSVAADRASGAAGWTWYASETDAYTAHGLTVPEPYVDPRLA